MTCRNHPHPTATPIVGGGATATSSRIPLALQSIFLNGNRGNVVNAPPPGKTAMKVFQRFTWTTKNKRCTTVTKTSCIVEQDTTTSTSSTTTYCDDNLVTDSPTGKRSKKKKVSIPTLSPQQYLNGIVFSRGYSTTIHSTLSMSEYYNVPTPHQRASYGSYVMNVIRSNSDGNDANIEQLQELMDLGLSPNACNVHGESIVHNVCRRSNLSMFQVLLRAGCDVRISDDSGRTPLHDACWATEPNFDIVEILLRTDIQLLYLADKHGHLPLSYTRQEQWDAWLQFLQSKKDVFWPIGGSDKNNNINNSLTILDSLPADQQQGRRRSVPDPKHNLSHNVCAGIANGTIQPCDVQYYLNHDSTDFDDSSYCSDDSDDDDDNDDSDCEDFDEEDDDKFNDTDDQSIHSFHVDDDTNQQPKIFSRRHSCNMLDESWNIHEMNDVLESISSPIKRPLAW